MVYDQEGILLTKIPMRGGGSIYQQKGMLHHGTHSNHPEMYALGQCQLGGGGAEPEGGLVNFSP